MVAIIPEAFAIPQILTNSSPIIISSYATFGFVSVVMIPEATFGAYYKIKDFKLGISIPGILSPNMEITASKENTLYSHFYTMLSYKKKLNDQWSIYPSILVDVISSITIY